MVKNQISEIEPGTFTGLDSLTYLRLWGNSISELEARTFCGLESIEELLLDINVLTSLPQDVFIHLPRPLILGLYRNPLQCDAALCWLRQEELNGTITWYREENGYTSKPVCANGVNWDNWSCSQTGDVSLINVLPHLSLLDGSQG